MIRTRIIRAIVLAVCASGIAGMIVTSVTDHNGAAITFGLVTAVAVLCQMVATTVANEATGATGATGAPLDRSPSSDADAAAADLEARIDRLVVAGADESMVRDLVRQAVRLGRHPRQESP